MVCGSTTRAWYSNWSKSCLDILVAGLGLHVDAREAGRAWESCLPSRSLRVISRSTSSGSAAWMRSPAGGLEENARIAQRDGPVAVVGHDQADRHDAVAEVVDAEDGFLFLGVIRFGGDGHVLFVVNFNGGKGGGRLHRRRVCDRWPLAATPAQ